MLTEERSRTAQSQVVQHRVSFIVSTLNAERTVNACLASIRAQQDCDVEVIVVDNSSSDCTNEIARAWATEVIVAGPERSAQRNIGAMCSTGDVLVFIDADMVLEPEIAAQAIAALAAQPDVGAFVIPELACGTGFLARCRAFEKELYLGDASVEAARIFRRSAFLGVGGYDEDLNAFEDWDVADRVAASGWRVGRVESTVWHDEGRISLRRQFAKKKMYGRNGAQYLAGLHSRRFVRDGLLHRPLALVRRPLLSIGLALLKTVEASGIVLGARATRHAESPLQPLDSAHRTRRVLHVICEFDEREGMGRSLVEVAKRVSGEHHVIAAKAVSGALGVASVTAVGGARVSFALTRARALRRHVAELQPDIVHLHGGPFAALLGMSPALRRRTKVLTMYAWPQLPARRLLRRASPRALLSSQVLRPRIVLASLLPARSIVWAIACAGVQRVLSPDRLALERLREHGAEATRMPAGASADPRRAQWRAASPLVVFAGRAETVRGIDTLLDAVPLLLSDHPGIRVRLLLLRRRELRDVTEMIADRGLHQWVDVVHEPCADLRDEFCRASLLVLPFKFDYVTIPPALTAAEAMSVGLPVIGTDVVCLNAIIEHDRNGLLVPIDDPAALARTIADILSDASRWQRLANGAVASIADHHDWDLAAPVVESAYARCRSNAGARR